MDGLREVHGRMGLAGWLMVSLVALCGLYLFLLAPNWKKRQAPAWFHGFFAHRGLHGGGVPENSLSAFRLAAEHGFGVELDVRLTLDGQLAVHHDDSLARTCGVERDISSMTMAEVKACRLMGTEENVPSFQEVIAAIGGRVPMIVELKTAGKRNDELAEKVCRLVLPIASSTCVESFDPRLMRWFRKRAPEVFRGQLAQAPSNRRRIREQIAAGLLMNFLSRPDFVAYDQEADRRFSLRLMRRLFHPPLAAWTVRSEDRSKALLGRYDVQIFEGFLPEQTIKEKQP